ncbi:putative nucleic acid-binding protein [Geodermatophilus bullaregiensis]|uniref:type II toxin-antitoxin system VapC family toxin n=1 Tax=Geodermatophilus bullaregiensis TaxID=1564160 RepID=UPI00195AB8AA|nr:type II toxin-antitoxin system VapC family toxin [Geodermatophilus bullaregiensis]MBM7805914.1 putative nucleic acid-binding protein [Geodermatophilus bullaregiensis]
MTVFADSSALVKLYADEAGHEQVRALFQLVVSQPARVEVPSAIWRKQRPGELDAGAARLLTSAFEADWSGTEDGSPGFSAVSPTTAVLEGAARLCAVHGLRPHDAVQLACALAARTALPECRTFAAVDRQLRAAAAAEGFTLVPASSEV